MRKLAEQVKTSFASIRSLFRKYGENIEVVDPQLKNNADLADALLAFEKAWEKGKEFFLNKGSCNMLISFSQLIEGLTEKHKEVQEKIESMDADIFIIIPCLAILKSLDENDTSIYTLYYPELSLQSGDQQCFDNIKKMYTRLKQQTTGYALYNIVEQLILELPLDVKQVSDTKIIKEHVDKLLHEIKKLAMLLQRSKPTEWNSLMETAMGII